MRKGARMDPAILSAFADGQLEPEEAARVVMHLADCPEDQRVVDGIMSMNHMLSRACAGPLDEAVPPAILATIRGPGTAEATPAGGASGGAASAARPETGGGAPPRRARGRPTRARAGGARWPRLGLPGALLGGALAASIAAAVVFFPRQDAPLLALGDVPAGSPVAAALDHLASGETRRVGRGAELDVLASFAVADGYCREMLLRSGEARNAVGLACGRGDGWRITAWHELPEAAATSGYVPAGGAGGDPLGAELDALGATFALGADEERAAREAGWH